MAKFTTQWHRFNTVTTIPSQTSPYSGDNIIGSGTGTASMNNALDILELSTPTVIDSDGNTATFSSVIPSDAIITGIQYQAYMDAEGTTSISLIHHEPTIGSTVIDYATNANAVSQFTLAQVYGGGLNQMQSSITDNDLGLGSTLSLSNVDDIKFRLNFVQRIAALDFYIVGKDFEDANGPSPAVRLEYELRPKVTIATGGKLSITQGKMHIV